MIGSRFRIMSPVVWMLASLTFASLFLFASALVPPLNEEVSFSSRDGFQLEGTLRLPASTSPANPIPGVVLIHGSGEVNRDALLPVFGYQIPVFGEIGDALQAHAIAVLTYDKRICSSFNNCYNNSYPLLNTTNVTVDPFIEDAQAAVQFLQTRSEINAIVTVGHSQGATYIPILLESEADAIDSGVMVAGSFHPFDELYEWQLNLYSQMLSLFGINASMCIPDADLVPIVIEWLEAIRNGVDVPDLPGFATAAYWKSLLDAHNKSMAAAAKVDQPMLVLQGDMDWMVPPSDAEAWSSYLNEVGADYETRLLPCVTHPLNCILRFPYDIGNIVDPQVTDSLIDFVLRSTAAGTSGVIRLVWRPTMHIFLVIAALASVLF